MYAMFIYVQYIYVPKVISATGVIVGDKPPLYKIHPCHASQIAYNNKSSSNQRRGKDNPLAPHQQLFQVGEAYQPKAAVPLGEGKPRF